MVRVALPSLNKQQQETLVQILQVQDWERAVKHVQAHPEEAAAPRDPSPLALACRYGAPLPCVQALLKAAPEKVRHMLDARGTPIHEAIVCETVGPETIAALLQVDESLGTSSTTRATLLQDVDGYTVLHLLIRRRFQSHIMYEQDEDEDDATRNNNNNNNNSTNAMMQILEMLVRSCPEAVVIPDRGEYEEPPIVYALKANIYAPSLGSEDATLARVEQQIHDMVACMLRHCPTAASRVFTGYRGQYTALHSAVFHGRYTTTIDLLLRTERENQETNSRQKAALLANTQGEMPLHFSAMRGERSQTVALIAQAAPEAICARDTSGLTPFHWLWVRQVCNMLALDRDGRGESSTIALPNNPLGRAANNNNNNGNNNMSATSFSTQVSRYAAFSALEQGDFDRDLQLIKRMDPPVDFLRMRHIPTEVLGPTDCFRWAEQSVTVLKEVRDRYQQQQQQQQQQNAADDLDQERNTVWNRRQVISSLFWTKVVALLEAGRPILEDGPQGDDILVHTAFATPSCSPAVVSVVAALYPEELSLRDEKGRWPIHYAAQRAWNVWDFPREGQEAPASGTLLMHETLRVLCLALDLSPAESLCTPDMTGRWVLHQVIETLCRATARSLQWSSMAPDMLQLVKEIVQIYPDVLTKADGKTNLVPFLQASTAEQEGSSELFSISLSFELLRMDPSVLNSML